MSRTELSRLRVMIDLADGRTRVEDAAALMGLQRRQVYRLLDAFRTQGADALISKRRGKPSNRAHGASFRKTCVAGVQNYVGQSAQEADDHANSIKLEQASDCSLGCHLAQIARLAGKPAGIHGNFTATHQRALSDAGALSRHTGFPA